MDREKIEACEKEHQVHEERRLLYVAFTRAKEKLYLTYAQEYGGRKYSPSLFLDEIEYKANKDIIYSQDLAETQESTPQIVQAYSMKRPERTHVFSPSSLLLFADCAKRYEYRYIYNMPEEEIVHWEALQMGSFIHMIIEYGVKEQFKTLQQFITFTQQMHSKPEWETLDMQEAKRLVSVFFERNKNKYNEKSLNEQKLTAVLQGIKFHGIADRIDFHSDGVEIIDYKTGKYIEPRARNWQLGFYALASKKFGKVKKVTLDMLKNEKPLEFEIDERGIAKEAITGRMTFNLRDIEKELVSTAQEIISCYEKGFPTCSPDKNCEFCAEHVMKK